MNTPRDTHEYAQVEDHKVRQQDWRKRPNVDVRQQTNELRDRKGIHEQQQLNNKQQKNEATETSNRRGEYEGVNTCCIPQTKVHWVSLYDRVCIVIVENGWNVFTCKKPERVNQRQLLLHQSRWWWMQSIPGNEFVV